LCTSEIEYVGQPVARGVVDPGAVGEILQGDRVTDRGGIVGGDHHDEFLGSERTSDTRPARRLGADGEIGFSCVHRGDELVGVSVLEQADADIRMRLSPTA
jgi:hypothetical protein